MHIACSAVAHAHAEKTPVLVPHKNTVILLEPNCGTIREAGLPVVKFVSTPCCILLCVVVVAQIFETGQRLGQQC